MLQRDGWPWPQTVWYCHVTNFKWDTSDNWSRYQVFSLKLLTWGSFRVLLSWLRQKVTLYQVDVWLQWLVQRDKEYVASLIGLYKNNGAVSCVGIDFHLIRSLYHARTQLVHSDTELVTIILWAIVYSNCNTFLTSCAIWNELVSWQWQVIELRWICLYFMGQNPKDTLTCPLWLISPC